MPVFCRGIEGNFSLLEYDGMKLELSDGRLIISPPTSELHGIKSNRLSFKIGAFVHPRWES